MAFNSTITIPDINSVNHNYAETSQDSTGSIRIDTSTNLDAPKLMVIRHNQQKDPKGGPITDRHLLQFSHVKNDTAGIARTLVFNATLSVPRGGLFTQAEAEMLCYLAFNFALGGAAQWDNLKALLRGER